MRINIINCVIALLISTLLGWWLWNMGIEDNQKWLLAFLGGGVIALGLVGSMGLSFENERGGALIRIVCTIMSCVVAIASCIFSFFRFSASGYCIPIGVFALLCIFTIVRIYNSRQ